MYEEIILYSKSDTASATDTDNVTEDNKTEVKEDNNTVVVDIDYKQIEIAYYNALKQIELEKANREALEKAISEENTDVVDFATGSDARLYTVSTSDAPTSSAQQTTAYLLDLRNICLIFLLSYFVITAYTKLKNTLTKYYGGSD